MNANDAMSKEDAALDKKIKSRSPLTKSVRRLGRTHCQKVALSGLPEHFGQAHQRYRTTRDGVSQQSDASQIRRPR
jgi:hypothetical protein